MNYFRKIFFTSSMLYLLLFSIIQISYADKLSPGVKHFFSIPRPQGATLKLIIDKIPIFENEEEESTPYHAILDYLIKRDSLAVRVHILNGDMTNQRILIKLGKDEQYYIFHPLLGINAVRRIQMAKQLTYAGFNLNDLITILAPLRETDIKDWSSQANKKGVIVFSPANKQSCRDEYHFSSYTALPYTLWFCQGTRQKQLQIQLIGKTFLHSYVLPERVTFKKNMELKSEIQIKPTTFGTWKNINQYSKEKLGKTLHPSSFL